MEADPVVHLPCSSIAVDSVLRLSSAGAIWGACYGPFAAKRLGLSGSYRASYIAKTVGQCGFYCGLFAAIFSFSHCGIQRYRRRNDWVSDTVSQDPNVLPSPPTQIHESAQPQQENTITHHHELAQQPRAEMKTIDRPKRKTRPPNRLSDCVSR
ncbi:hypothetical protein SASPL_103424 [Salvia splendens]|uniref:Uncharacterized protein n=1 Tax=Salvia splendens TaxID=180675 RepID=A0A8X8YG43_SALSN|nr:outer envelope pore protein 16-4, chloroplastic-like isoform X1 [Salvia splendens]KAG6431856.1 hypothetical protein SASPL_103424 [Salvia splendens]